MPESGGAGSFAAVEGRAGDELGADATFSAFTFDEHDSGEGDEGCEGDGEGPETIRICGPLYDPPHAAHAFGAVARARGMAKDRPADRAVILAVQPLSWHSPVSGELGERSKMSDPRDAAPTGAFA